MEFEFDDYYVLFPHYQYPCAEFKFSRMNVAGRKFVMRMWLKDLLTQCSYVIMSVIENHVGLTMDPFYHRTQVCDLVLSTRGKKLLLRYLMNYIYCGVKIETAYSANLEHPAMVFEIDGEKIFEYVGRSDFEGLCEIGFVEVESSAFPDKKFYEFNKK